VGGRSPQQRAGKKGLKDLENKKKQTSKNMKKELGVGGKEEDEGNRQLGEACL